MNFKRKPIFVFSLLNFLLFSLANGAPSPQSLTISAQFVGDRILNSGLDAKQIELESQKADYGLSQVMGRYDWNIYSKAGYEISRIENLTGFANPEDATSSWSFGVSKRLRTGTTVSIDYGWNAQDSVLNSFLLSLRPSYQVLDVASLRIRQEVLGNFFGILDRGRINNEEKRVAASALGRQESLQDLLIESLRLYWKTFVAKENMKQALKSLDKHSYLTKVLQQKVSQNLADRSDLAKIKAELESQERNAKISSLNYATLLDQLFLLMKLDAVSDVEFDVDEKIPSPPPSLRATQNSRRTRQAELLLEVAEKESEAAQWNSLPSLAIVGEVAFTGLDRDTPASLSELVSGDHPRYYVGLELSMPLDSDLTSGEKSYRQILHDQARYRVQQIKDQHIERLRRVSRDVTAKHAVAISATAAVRQWEIAIKEQERKFRVGRIGSSDLILDYASQFRAEASKSAAIADYYLSIHEFKAAQGVLVKGEASSP